MIFVLGIGSVLPSAGEREVLNFDLSSFPVAPKNYLDRASALALAAASLAMQDAGLSGTFDGDFGVVVGTRFGAVETMQKFESALHEKGARGASPLLFSHSGMNAPASLLAIEWGLKGVHAPLVGQNSGWEALETAKSALESGHATHMLVGAVEALSFARAWASEPDPGEGALFFVLSSEKNEPRRAWNEVFGERRDELEGDWGALGEVLRRWNDAPRFANSPDATRQVAALSD